MPRNRKLLIHGKVYEICFRTEEGLPFAPTPYIKAIWESILARAQSLYRVRIVAGILMSNHPHLLIRVEDPEDVPKFVAYVKKETAHALNRLLGVEQHTVWQRCSVPDCSHRDKSIIGRQRRLGEEGQR